MESYYPSQEYKQGTGLQLSLLKNVFAEHLVLAAPDLGTNNLATLFADSLFATFDVDGLDGQELLEAVSIQGSEVFYKVGLETLGPIAVGFVDEVLKSCDGGYVVFPARDATPFYHIATTLLKENPAAYSPHLTLCNPVFNRKTWGVDDEQDQDDPVTAVSDPLVQQLLAQIGFADDEPVAFVEVGAWGSMVDSMKMAMSEGMMPKKEFAVYFLFTHMPEYIYGYLNQYAVGIEHAALEAIADSFEALPKYFMRPTELVNIDGYVQASLEGKLIDSPFLHDWCLAAQAGFVEAARQFASMESPLPPNEKIAYLKHLGRLAHQGMFNGMLPEHTETWTEGADWHANWQWGQIKPMGEK